MANSTFSLSDLLVEYYVGKHASICYNAELKFVLCTATASYIPMAEFIEVFTKAEELVKRKKLTKCIFDERKLGAFHLPSMEWYHLTWKERMYRYGLVSYRKILPEDKQFEYLVNLGKRKIRREHPEFVFEKYDIVYCHTLEEAVES